MRLQNLETENLFLNLNNTMYLLLQKCDSLFDAEYQNFVIGDKTGRYFYERKQALELLTSEGFNEVKDDGTTRLGFDMIVSKRNISEVEKTLRYCRDNNMWIVFSCYLPSGRSAKK